MRERRSGFHGAPMSANDCAWPRATVMRACAQTLMRMSSAMGTSVDAMLGRTDIARVEERRWAVRAASAAPGVEGAVRRLGKAAPNTLRVLDLFLKEIELEQRRRR